MEAAIEADWRGIAGPAPSRDSSASGDTGGGGSVGSGPALLAADASPPTSSENQEYLRMLSRAMQQPGRSPRTFTAEILHPPRENAASDTACCQPRVDASSLTMAAAGRTGALRRPFLPSRT